MWSARRLLLTRLPLKIRKYIDAPPVHMEDPVEVAQTPEVLKLSYDEFYKSLDHEMALLSQKKSNVLVNPALTPAEVIKLSRKIGKSIKYMEFLKGGYSIST